MVDFIFLGPSKTASTWIFEVLRPHPQLFVPASKDIYFFDKYFERGVAWYERFFSDAPEGCACGELSHDYFSSEQAIRRIHAYDPDIKLICCLRNPFERAYSSYQHLVRVGLCSGSFETALKEFPFIVDEGRYHTNLCQILACFDRASVLVLDFDELEADPRRFARRIFSFLQVDEDFVPDVLDKKINTARRPRSKLLARMAKQAALLIRKLGYPNLLGRLKHSRLINRIVYRPDAEGAKQATPQRVYPDHLVRLYHNELDELSLLLQTDYSKWRLFPDKQEQISWR
ncbi:MAG: sulfotransferase [Sideroxyarcus sp.]|nr:sulfotransferase [Sideroxyarcus sp.]